VLNPGFKSRLEQIHKGDHLKAFNILFFLISLAFIQFTHNSAHAGAITGKVVNVADGDTITVLHNGIQEKIRLYGIDASEKKQGSSVSAIEPEPRRRQNASSPSPPRGAAWKGKESKVASVRAPAGHGLDGFCFPCYPGI
jgi:hypothetical protein